TLYHDTVRKINSRDYASAQIQAWAGAAPDEEKWRKRQSIERPLSMNTTALSAASRSWKTTDTLVPSMSTRIIRDKGSPPHFWTEWRRRLWRGVPHVFRLKPVSRRNLSSQSAGSKPSRRRT